MSSDDVELLRQGYESFNRTGRVPLEIFHEEIEFMQLEGLLGTGTYHGHAGLERALGDLLEGFEQMRLEPQEVLHDDGSELILAVRVSARGKGSGVEVEATVFHVWSFRDGKAASWRAYAERESAFEAVRQSA